MRAVGGIGVSEADSVCHSRLKSLEHHVIDYTTTLHISLMLVVFHLLNLKATLS